MRRRKPDSIEVQQMKAQAAEEKTARLAERLVSSRGRKDIHVDFESLIRKLVV